MSVRGSSNYEDATLRWEINTARNDCPHLWVALVPVQDEVVAAYRKSAGFIATTMHCH